VRRIGKKELIVLAVVGGAVVFSVVWLSVFSLPPVEDSTPVAREPNIAPDYCGITIPPNIAPLNFRVLEPGQTYRVKMHADGGAAIDIASRTGSIRIPNRKWRTLLAANTGGEIFVDVYVKHAEKGWLQFQRISNRVAREAIDDTLVYRFMKPIYNAWKYIGIYQRRLAGFHTSQVLHGRSFGEGCLNCHSFVNNTADTMTIGLRSQTYGSHTLLVQGHTARKIGAKWGYTAWHPRGQLAVYSINKVRQFFHTGGMEVRDVVDLDSALVCYYADRRKAVCPAELADKSRLETYPTWSPDGRYLYYCSAPILWSDRDTVPPENYDKLKYDLRRIAYDVKTDQWGKAETVLAAEETGLSILLPRISPDGRFLLFCMCRYGCFPVYQPSSDLYLMDLATGDYRKLAINSPYSESWHSWSSNSRWIAFSSKRQGGSLTRTYFSYVEEAGRVRKPFVLPQKDPAYYDSLLETYSVPELIKGRVPVSRSLLARVARGAPAVAVDLPLTGATPQAGPSEPWHERE
jgi:hypothetical protein